MPTLNSQQYINIQCTTYKQIQNIIEQMELYAPCPQFQLQLQHSHITGLAALLQRNIFWGNKVFVGKAGIRNIEFWQYMYI
jgi:hypothetical protein